MLFIVRLKFYLVRCFVVNIENKTNAHLVARDKFYCDDIQGAMKIFNGDILNYKRWIMRYFRDSFFEILRFLNTKKFAYHNYIYYIIFCTKESNMSRKHKIHPLEMHFSRNSNHATWSLQDNHICRNSFSFSIDKLSIIIFLIVRS